MFPFLPALTSGCFLLLAFIIGVNSRKVNVIANRWLGVFLFCIGIALLDDPLFFNTQFRGHPIYQSVMNISFFSLAPTLYFCISYFVTPAKTFEKKDLWHFSILFIIIFGSVISLFLPTEIKSLPSEAEMVSQTFLETLFGLLLTIIPVSIYWLLCYKKLLAHLKNVQLYASSIETVDLAWLRYFLWGLVVMIVVMSCQIIFSIPFINSICYVVYLVLAFYLAYFAVQQGAVFNQKTQDDLDLKVIIEESLQPEVARKQLFSEEQLTNLKIKLSTLMDKQKPYLVSDLGLPKLAQMMELSTNELSYLINAGFEDNFYGFVNQYRVEESKRILMSLKYQHLSMVGIAFEAGFNSKTAFNTAFKKIVGVSPTEFQKIKTP